MKTNHPESGNVFIFILLGIGLFTALMFTVSKSMQTQTATQMNARDAKLAATEILDYAQRLERAVARISRKGVSENEISFQNAADAGYTPGNVQPETHHVFNTQGGSINWVIPPEGVNDGTNWLITGETCVKDVGTGGTNCASDNLSNEELLLILPNLDSNVCTELNKMLDIDTIPAETGTGYSSNKFTGTFEDDTKIDVGSPYKTACYSKSNSYYFYHTLIAR